ncbi:hypothetical protein TCAL_17140 [Tigriopus californicus]|uniref:Uncharacterized protein n=1 Tax=Tigriopus californicus TaxID=6832 RepID=A0A553P4X2_TIGCA|nr:hypothetical protein TCAL_17140 [Tigriopus californicus]
MTKSKLRLLSQKKSSKCSNQQLLAFGLAFVVIYVLCSASAQELKPDPTCVCDPLCQIYPNELQPNSCELQVPRSDCPCCRVCAGEAGEPCHPISQPCDASQGLECQPDSKTCQGPRATLEERMRSDAMIFKVMANNNAMAVNLMIIRYWLWTFSAPLQQVI